MKLLRKSTGLAFAAACLLSSGASAQNGQKCTSGNSLTIMGAIACAGSFDGNNKGNDATVAGVLATMKSSFQTQTGAGSWWSYVGDANFSGGNTGTINLGSAVTGYFVVILKASNDYSMYLFNGGTSGISKINFTDYGTSVNSQGIANGLSHASLYKWNGTTPPPPVTATPEPATVVLMGSGLLGIVAFRRRRKKA